MDPRLILGLISGRDVAQDAAWRQRPPVTDHEQINRMLINSFRQLAGDSSDPSDDDSPLLAGPDRPVAGTSPDFWRSLFDNAEPGARFRPDPQSRLDDGVLRLQPGTDPLSGEPSKPDFQYLPDIQSLARPRSSVRIPMPEVVRPGDRSDGQTFETAIGRVGSSGGGARVDLGIARVGSSGGGVSARANYRSPAPGLLAVSGPSGAGSSSTTASHRRDRGVACGPSVATSSSTTQPAPTAAAASSPASAGSAVKVLPTEDLTNRLVAAALQRSTALAEKAAETSVDRLRREIFANQAARNSLFSH